MEKWRSRGGFAVIELAVVVLIVLSLSLVAGVSYRKYIIRSKLSECIMHIQNLRRLAIDHMDNEGQYPTPETFQLTTRDDPSFASFSYAVLSTGEPKSCNLSDSNKGHGNDCDRKDEDNRGSSAGSSGPVKKLDGTTVGADLERSGTFTMTPLRYGFEITCTHDHTPIAQYVYVNSLIPNAIIVQWTPTNAP